MWFDVDIVGSCAPQVSVVYVATELPKLYWVEHRPARQSYLVYHIPEKKELYHIATLMYPVDQDDCDVNQPCLYWWNKSEFHRCPQKGTHDAPVFEVAATRFSGVESRTVYVGRSTAQSLVKAKVITEYPSIEKEAIVPVDLYTDEVVEPLPPEDRASVEGMTGDWDVF